MQNLTKLVCKNLKLFAFFIKRFVDPKKTFACSGPFSLLPSEIFVNGFYFTNSNPVMVSEYGYLILPGTFPVKVAPDIDVTDEAVVQWKLPVVKIFL